MITLSAEQRRYIDNAVLIAAVRLTFDTLRKEYQSYKLSEMIAIHNGQGLKSEDRDSEGFYEVYAAGGSVGNHSNYLTNQPCVVIGRKGSAGKPTYAPNGGWVIDTAYYAQPKDENILDCQFLYYALSSLDFSKDIISTAIPGINRTAIYQHSIPVPPISIQIAANRFFEAANERQVQSLRELPFPLDEQRRIVAHIEALAVKIEEARGLRRGALEEAERIQKSAISDVFDRTIQASKWQLRPITEAAQIARGKFSFRPRNDPRFYGGDIPFIQIGDISSSTKYIKEYSQTLNEVGLEISRLFPIGTVVIAITGATIGATGILTFPSCFPDSIVGFIAIDGLTTSEFIYWSLEYAKQSALDEAKTTTQPNINLEKLRRILIPIPSLDEQAHISEYLNNLQLNIEALHSLQVGVVEELDALLPSILDKAFKGEL